MRDPVIFTAAVCLVGALALIGLKAYRHPTTPPPQHAMAIYRWEGGKWVEFRRVSP